MNTARDFRKYAREDLKGKWPIAVFAGLIAGILGGTATRTINFNLNIDASGFQAGANFNTGQDFSFITKMISDMFPFILGFALYALIFGIALSVLYFMLGSVIGLGYTRFNLNLVDGEKPQIGTLFDYFPHWKRAVAVRFLMGLFTFFWTLLFIIPGIIAAYRYSMAPYIIAENPEMTAREAIQRSKEMMDGNKVRLFCLELSFIGWSFLATLTLGIGYLVLNPYMEAAKAIFYRDISGTGWAMSGGMTNEMPADEPQECEKETVNLDL